MGQDIRQSYFQHFIGLHDEKPFNPSPHKKTGRCRPWPRWPSPSILQLKAERPDGIDLDQRLRKPVAAKIIGVAQIQPEKTSNGEQTESSPRQHITMPLDGLTRIGKEVLRLRRFLGSPGR